MLCPRCQIPLKTITLKSITQIAKKNDYTDKIDIDICPSCHGVWLDKGELEKLIETARNELKLSPIGEANIECNNDVVAGKITDFALQNKEKLREEEIVCPRCNTIMQKHPYAITSGILIDSCPKECGIWLDKGEILRIADYLATAEKPLSNTQKEQVKERLRMFAEANKEKVSPLQFLNKRYYNETELEKDLNTTPTGQYVSIIRMVVQGLLYFLLRRGRF